MFILPKVPKEYLVFALLIGLIILAILKINSWTTATIGMIAGYLVGRIPK